MTDQNPKPIGPHDVGGLPGEAIDRRDHDAAYWERQVDAMVMLLHDKGIIDFSQLRRGIESLDADVYEKLSYYERWASSAAGHAIEQGLVTPQELDARIAEIKSKASS
jgi:hypothetical protein